MKNEQSYLHFRSTSVVDIASSKDAEEMLQINDGRTLSSANAGSVPQLDSRILQESCSSNVAEQLRFTNSEGKYGKFFALFIVTTTISGNKR